MPDVIEQLRRYADAAEAAALPSSPSHTRGRRSRRAVLLGAAAAVAVLLGSGLLALRSAPDQKVLSGDSGSEKPEGEWSVFPPAPIGVRAGAAVATSEAELIVWGGWNDTTRADGAAFSYRDETWRSLPSSPLSPRVYPLAVWTGQEMIVWSGIERFASLAESKFLGDGAAYDPAADTWRSLPGKGIGGRQGDTAAVWTGEEVVFVGVVPRSAADERSDTWAYDPGTDRWRELPSMPALGSRRELAAVWTGTDILVVSMADSTAVTIDTLDPRSGTWADRVTTSLPGLDIGTDGVVWAQGRLLVIGHYRPGAVYDPASRSFVGLPTSNSQSRYPAVEIRGLVSVGDRWLDVASLKWHRVAPEPRPQRQFPSAVVHQGRLYLWGGNACGATASCERLVDPKNGLIWTPPRSIARP